MRTRACNSHVLLLISVRSFQLSRFRQFDHRFWFQVSIKIKKNDNMLSINWSEINLFIELHFPINSTIFCQNYNWWFNSIFNQIAKPDGRKTYGWREYKTCKGVTGFYSQIIYRVIFCFKFRWEVSIFCMKTMQFELWHVTWTLYGTSTSCSKFGNFQAKRSKDIEQPSLGLQTNQRTGGG